MLGVEGGGGGASSGAVPAAAGMASGAVGPDAAGAAEHFSVVRLWIQRSVYENTTAGDAQGEEQSKLLK